MDREKLKNTITFRLVNCKTGEIEYELIKQYDLYYLFDRNFLHSKLDDFFRKIIEFGDVGSYCVEFVSSVRKPIFEIELPF